MKNNGKLVMTLVSLVLIVICVNTTIAYFTAKDKGENVFTVGSIAIEIIEPSWDESEEHLIVADAEYKKDPTVKNTGKNDAYVRIVLTVSDYQEFMKYGGSDYQPSTMFDITDKWELTSPAVIEGNKVIYRYTYKEVLPANQSTSPLFNKVKMPSFANQAMVDEMGMSFDILVKAEAIQADGFSNYTEAFSAYESQIGG